MCLSLCVFVLLLIFLISSSFLIHAQPVEYPMADLSTSWINRPSPVRYNTAKLTPILLRGSTGTRFVCGFYCDSRRTGCLFAILIFQNGPDSSNSSTVEAAQVVWSANRNNPVRINATLKLTQDGDLILADSDGTLVWSTNTDGKSVSGLNLTEMGNLVLFDKNNAAVWQSFDHPTDSLVPGQMLVSGQKLTASVSVSNWSQGLFSLAIIDGYLVAYMESNPNQFYYKSSEKLPITNAGQSYIQFKNGSFGELIYHQSLTTQFIKLGEDGHLRAYECVRPPQWDLIDLLRHVHECDYPMVCGKYGICTNGQCDCPKVASGETSFFRKINPGQRNPGCSLIFSPISCNYSQHSLLELKDTNCITSDSSLYISAYTVEDCKKTCLNKCSCKGALFSYSELECWLLSEIFSLKNNEGGYENFSMFIKVQNSPIPLNHSKVLSPKKKSRRDTTIILGSSIGAFFGMFLIVGTYFLLFGKKKEFNEVEEDYLDQVPGMPTRFYYQDLKSMTENFRNKLGEGGFGSVFQGTMSDGNQIAVKRLDGLGQVKKSFLAEVQTIGSIHHVNLVRLVGFCAEKSNRLLVYEYMSNGSLDKWIFNRNQELALGWESRRKIILDIAKGLAYLHEDCRQKIFHLDIKPQNILLDENFNAKVSDFGLSKLIDKDQSQVVTTMRGTPGYLAPEWLSSVITEKVDVYSFGVVVLEILCGRKLLDRSQTEEDMHLPSLFKRKAEEEQLLHLIDRYSEDMQLQGAQVVEMMRLAAWCLQSDFVKRPSMSVVVKVLEGSVNVENNLDYSFTNPSRPRITTGHKDEAVVAATPILPIALSGPR